MELTTPPQTFELGSCWPRWDNYRSARLAWAEHAQQKGFVVKESPQKYNIILSCASCSWSSSRPPYSVEVEFDGIDLSEKVVAITFRHTHRLSRLSSGEVAAQATKIEERRTELFKYALDELESIKRCGGREKLKGSDREVAQDRVMADVRRALGDETTDRLLEMARKRGFLVGTEAENDLRSIVSGFGLRPRPARPSPVVPGAPSSTSPVSTATTTPLPDSLRTFRTLNHLDKSINPWAHEQGFSVRPAEEGMRRHCSAKKTAAKCGWSIRIEVKSPKKVVVLEECAAHTHPLEKRGSSVKLAPKSTGSGKRRERSAAVEPEKAEIVKLHRDRKSTSLLDSAAQEQLCTPSLSPPIHVKRERDSSSALPVRQPSPSPSFSPSTSTCQVKRQRRYLSSALTEHSDDSIVIPSSSYGQQSLGNDPARSSPQLFSETDTLQHFLNKLIPEDSSLGDDYVHVFEAIGSRNPAFLMKMVEEDLEGVMELLSAEGQTRLPPLVLRALRKRLGGVKSA